MRVKYVHVCVNACACLCAFACAFAHVCVCDNAFESVFVCLCVNGHVNLYLLTVSCFASVNLFAVRLSVSPELDGAGVPNRF